MTPYEAIRSKYLEAPGVGLTWEELVGIHLAHPDCYVIKGPNYFVMGRAVARAAAVELIRDFTHRFNASECDTWHIYAFAGDMGKAFRSLPYPLPWLAWERIHDPELRFISTEFVKRMNPDIDIPLKSHQG